MTAEITKVAEQSENQRQTSLNVAPETGAQSFFRPRGDMCYFAFSSPSGIMPGMEESERLQKILAQAGYGSRRACEGLIEEGRVTVDGEVAQLGDKADPTTQRIAIDGVSLRRAAVKHTYVMLHKPEGVLTTTSDPHGRKTVLDLVPLETRVYPVGRLDYESEGLVLLTDDGKITQELTHPSYRHTRVYRALVKGEPTAETLDRWQRGITLEGRAARFDEVVVEKQERGQAWLRVTVHEGRNHLVRRIVAALGHPVMRLIRIAMGPLSLGNLASGKWRYLTDGEISALTGEAASVKKSPGRRSAARGSNRAAPPERRGSFTPSSSRRTKPSRDRGR